MTDRRAGLAIVWNLLCLCVVLSLGMESAWEKACGQEGAVPTPSLENRVIPAVPASDDEGAHRKSRSVERELWFRLKTWP